MISDVSAVCVEVAEALERDWADQEPGEREAIVRHLESCAPCRRTAVAADPLWAFRVALESSSPAEGDSFDAAVGDAALDIQEMQQRVRGAIRARALQSTESGPATSTSRLDDTWRWLTAAGLVVASGLAVVFGSHSEMADPAGAVRAEVTRYVEALPVVDDAGWPAARTAETLTGSREAAELPQVLAHLSDREADVVWVVNAALEL